jgi:acyl carrier protein
MMDVLSTGQRQDLENTGINMLTTEQGVRLLSVLLQQQAEPQLLAASMNWERLYRQSAQPLSIITGLLNATDGVPSDSEKQTTPELQTGPIMADLTEITDEQQRYAGLKSYIRQRVAEHLGFAATQLEDDVGFSETGMDSLTAVMLKNDFQQAFGQALPVTLLINYHNIQALTDYLYQRLFAGQQQPTQPSRDGSFVADEIEELSEQHLAAIIASKLAAAE